MNDSTDYTVPIEHDAEPSGPEPLNIPDDADDVVIEDVEEAVVEEQAVSEKDDPDAIPLTLKIAGSLKMLQEESSDDKLYETMLAIVPGVPRAIAVYSDTNGVKYTVMGIPVAEKTTIICIGASVKSPNQSVSASTSCVLVPIGIEDIRGYMDEYSRKNSPEMHKLVSRIRDEISDECVRSVFSKSDEPSDPVEAPVSDSKTKRRGRPRKR